MKLTEMDVEESVADKEKIHEDIARIKAALQSDGGEASAEESDDQELEQAACPELAGVFYYQFPSRFTATDIQQDLFFATKSCPFWSVDISLYFLLFFFFWYLN